MRSHLYNITKQKYEYVFLLKIYQCKPTVKLYSNGYLNIGKINHVYSRIYYNCDVFSKITLSTTTIFRNIRSDYLVFTYHSSSYFHCNYLVIEVKLTL